MLLNMYFRALIFLFIHWNPFLFPKTRGKLQAHVMVSVDKNCRIQIQLFLYLLIEEFFYYFSRFPAYKCFSKSFSFWGAPVIVIILRVSLSISTLESGLPRVDLQFCANGADTLHFRGVTGEYLIKLQQSVKSLAEFYIPHSRKWRCESRVAFVRHRCTAARSNMHACMHAIGYIQALTTLSFARVTSSSRKPRPIRAARE